MAEDDRSLRSLRVRFWIDVEKRGADECWPWLGHTVRGYGKLHFKGKDVGSHRAAFFFAHGRWPEPFCLHRCDNPPCCNPGHLFEGDNAANMNDKTHKGRAPRGEKHWRAKLSDAAIREIRALKGKMNHSELARRFGVHRVTVLQIQRGIRWKHVT